MKMSEIQTRSDEELVSLLGQLKTDLFQRRGELVVNQVKDSDSIRRIRRDVARVLTAMRGRGVQR